MNFIKKIFMDKTDEEVHRQLSRYGKGIYDKKALVSIKKGKNLSVKTSFEYCNDLVRLIAENAKDDINVSGVIVMFKEFKFRDFEISKRGKVYKCGVEMKCSGKELLEICNEFKEGWLLFKIKTGGFLLNCKDGLPKPGGELKDNFCSASFDLSLKDEFAWDVKDFNELKISHRYEIKNISIPKEYEKDFVKARAYAKREGKLFRELLIDGKQEIKEKEFSA